MTTPAAPLTDMRIEGPPRRGGVDWIAVAGAVLGIVATVVAVGMMLSGCASREPYWSRHGAVAEDFRRESASCRNTARAIAASFPVHWLDIYDDCMRSHGWEKE
jgi:hypothetical protein